MAQNCVFICFSRPWAKRVTAPEAVNKTTKLKPVHNKIGVPAKLMNIYKITKPYDGNQMNYSVDDNKYPASGQIFGLIPHHDIITVLIEQGQLVTSSVKANKLLPSSFKKIVMLMIFRSWKKREK